jgi:hypothetical protein
MAHLRLIHLFFILGPLFMPTLARSEPVTLGYWARVQFDMLNPEAAEFECTYNDVPARIEIDDDTLGTILANFPTSLLDRPESSPLVTLRRGTEVVPELVDRTPIRARDDEWSMRIIGIIDFCIGPMTLIVMQGRLNVFAELGQYQAEILSSDNLLEDLNIEYDVNPSDLELVHFFHQKRDNFPSELNAQFVGSASAYDAETRVLGRLDLDASQLAINFTGPSDLDDVTQITRLNVRLIIEEAGLLGGTLPPLVIAVPMTAITP